jgi:hypothetical protein
MPRRLYNISLALVFMMIWPGYGRAADASFVVPYKVDKVFSVSVNTIMLFPESADGYHETACHPVAESNSGDVAAGDDGILAFYALFHTGGIHRQTLLCTNAHQFRQILIQYEPGKPDPNTAQVRQSELPLPAQCKGLWGPAVLMVLPANRSSDIRFGDSSFELFYAVSDPEHVLRETVRFRHGSQTTGTHATLFDIHGFPKSSPQIPLGFKVENAVTYAPAEAGTTYTVEVQFKQSWAAPGICTEWFAVGTFTAGL